MTSFSDNTTTRVRSDLWYILPIFGGIIGGTISWCAIKYDDPKKAKNCLLLGIVLTMIPIVLITILFALFGTTEISTIPKDSMYQPPIKFLDEFSI